MQQAAKRKHDETNSELATYEQLFGMIGSANELDAAELVKRIRSGHSAGAIVQYATTGNGPPVSDPQQFALHTFLVNLAHSTGSLRQVARLSMSISQATLGTRLPSPEDFNMLCNRIVQFSYMEEMLRATQHVHSVPILRLGGVGQSAIVDARDSAPVQRELFQHDVGKPDDPPYRAPAVPWSTTLSDHDAVSHLISVFLVWINPTWRFVEPDLFLKGNTKLQTAALGLSMSWNRATDNVILKSRRVFQADLFAVLLAFACK